MRTRLRVGILTAAAVVALLAASAAFGAFAPKLTVWAGGGETKLSYTLAPTDTATSVVELLVPLGTGPGP